MNCTLKSESMLRKLVDFFLNLINYRNLFFMNLKRIKKQSVLDCFFYITLQWVISRDKHVYTIPILRRNKK